MRTMDMKLGMEMMIGGGGVGPPADPGDTFLLEDGSGSILLESGSYLMNEDNP